MSLSTKWMQQAERYAQMFSDDPDTKVGVCVVRAEQVLAKATNVLPEGLIGIAERFQRPEKYKWIIHAEQAAISFAAREGISLEGARMYITLHPCNVCAQNIINAGITRVVTREPDMNRLEANYPVAIQMFKEAGVEVFYVD